MKSNLTELMKEKGMTVDQLCQETGLSRETVFRIRRGMIGKSKLETLEKIALALKSRVKDLFEENN